MSAFRACVLLGAFTAIALTVVCLRAEQTRCAARTLAIEARWVELRRELWSVHASISRLRAPGRIHDRVDWFQAGVVPPEEKMVTPRATRLVVNHP